LSRSHTTKQVFGFVVSVRRNAYLSRRNNEKDMYRKRRRLRKEYVCLLRGRRVYRKKGVKKEAEVAKTWNSTQIAASGGGPLTIVISPERHYNWTPVSAQTFALDVPISLFLLVHHSDPPSPLNPSVPGLRAGSGVTRVAFFSTSKTSYGSWNWRLVVQAVSVTSITRPIYVRVYLFASNDKHA